MRITETKVTQETVAGVEVERRGISVDVSKPFLTPKQARRLAKMLRSAAVVAEDNAARAGEALTNFDNDPF